MKCFSLQTQQTAYLFTTVIFLTFFYSWNLSQWSPTTQQPYDDDEKKVFSIFPKKEFVFYAVVLVVLFPKLNHTQKKEEARIYRIFFLHLLFSKPPTSSSVRKKDYPGSIPYVATIIILFSLERKKKDEKAYQHFSSPLPLSSSSCSELAGVLPFSFSRPKKGISKKN